MSELKTASDYRLFHFDFLDDNMDDFYRCQVVFKMFLEIDVVDKFNLSTEVTQPPTPSLTAGIAAMRSDDGYSLNADISSI